MSVKEFPPDRVRKIGEWKEWQNVYIQVIGAGTLFVATDRETLENPASGSILQGIAITSATVQLVYPWRGTMYGRGDPGTVRANIEIPRVTAEEGRAEREE